MFEVHGDAISGPRLDLTEPPVGALGVAHQGARLEEGIGGIVHNCGDGS